MDVVEPGTVIAGRYKVLGEIGRGGMGVVYRVEHVHTGEPLALKVLIGAARFDPQAVARFKREARASARIRSEHVVRVTDADTAPELDGSPFLVMELLSGTDLEKHVARHGPLPPETLVPLLAQVARALETAHGLGIVHRDLKPENLFLHEREDGSSIAKVLDFGISKFVSAEHALETAGMTSTGSVLGTPLYMAPEQAHGQNDKIAPTTDVWALGLVTLRLLTGEHYWGVPTMAELMMKIAVKDIIPPSERWPDGKHMSPALDAWFLRSCDRDQSKRWPSVELQIAELASVFGLALPSSASGSLDPRGPTRAVVGAATGSADSKETPPSTNEGREVLALADTEKGELPVTSNAGSEGEEPESVRAVSADDGAPSTSDVSEGPAPVATSSELSDVTSALSRSSRSQPMTSQRSRTLSLGGLVAVVLLGAFGVVRLRREEQAPAGSTTSTANAAAPPATVEPSAIAATASPAPASTPSTTSSRATVVAAAASSSPPAAAHRPSTAPPRAAPRPRATSSATAPAPAASPSASQLYEPLAP